MDSRLICIGNQGRHVHDLEYVSSTKTTLLPNGPESFNPVIIQTILTGDVYPQSGPNLKQKRKSRPGQDPKEKHSTASLVDQHANLCIEDCSFKFSCTFV